MMHYMLGVSGKLVWFNDAVLALFGCVSDPHLTCLSHVSHMRLT